MGRSRSALVRSVTGVLVTGVLVSGQLAACTAGNSTPDAAIRAFVTAWAAGDIRGQHLVTLDDKPLAGADAQQRLRELEGDLAAHRPKLSPQGKAIAKGDSGQATVAVAWPLGDGVTWEYPTTVAAHRSNDTWTVRFGSRTVHPQLGQGDRMTLTTTPAAHGVIVDGAGQTLVAEQPIVVLGIEPRRVENLDTVLQVFGSLFGFLGVSVDLSTLPARIRAAKPDAFVEIVKLRKPLYDQIAVEVRNTPGLVTHEVTLPAGPTPVFARALLGTSGEVTQELLDKDPARYHAGDVVGLSGLQRRYDDLLRGTRAVSVVLSTTKLQSQQSGQQRGTGGAATTPFVLYSAPPKSGGTVRTTLDQKIQNAADTALAAAGRRCALVAVRITDGAVVAVANGPGAVDVDVALTGRLPLADAGPIAARLAPTQPTPDVPPASQLGIGLTWDLGTDVYTGNVPVGQPASQGTVSPLVLAAAVAALARGQWTQPSLVLEPAPAKRAPDGPRLPKVDAATLTTTAGVWYVGSAGDLAFCVYVEAGNAQPVAAKFLSLL